MATRNEGKSDSPKGSAIDFEALLDRARGLGAEEAELFLETSSTNQIKAYQGQVESMVSANGKGLGVRVFLDKRMGFAYTSDFSESSLGRTVGDAVENARFSAPDPHNGLPETAVHFPDPDIYNPGLAETRVEKKIDLALAMEKAALGADPRIKNVMSSSYGDGSHEITLANSLGLHRSYKANYCSVSLFLVAQDGTSTQTGFAFDLGRNIESFDPEALAREAVGMAVSLLGARPVASQRVPVVFHRFVGAQILGVLTSPLTAEAVQRGRSLFAGKIGQRVASELVDLVDDGVLAGGMASAPFDGEGVPTARKELVSGGILNGFLHNSYSARKEGADSTGNAARGSFRATPEVSPSNFYLAPGKVTSDEVIRGVGDGFYVMEVSGLGTGGANPISGELSVGATGRWVKKGELAGPVREVTIAGNLIAMLRDVDAVADDLKFLGATGSPTFRVSSMSVGGKLK